MSSTRTTTRTAIGDSIATGVVERLFTGNVEGPRPGKKLKLDLSTPAGTYKALRHAVATRDLDLMLKLAAPGRLTELASPLGRELAPLFFAEFGIVKLGKLVEDGADRKVYTYYRNGALVTDDDQRFVKIDGKWLLDN